MDCWGRKEEQGRRNVFEHTVDKPNLSYTWCGQNSKIEYFHSFALKKQHIFKALSRTWCGQVPMSTYVPAPLYIYSLSQNTHSLLGQIKHCEMVVSWSVSKSELYVNLLHLHNLSSLELQPFDLKFEL